MSLNESIVEDAALEWFEELVPQTREVGDGAAFAELRPAKPSLAPGEYAGGTLTPALSQGARESYRGVVLVGRLREAIRRLNPAIPEKAQATIRRFRRVEIERRLNP